MNIKNSQTEIKVCQDKITSQQKVINEMLDKGKGFEIKVKELETNNKVEVDNLKQEMNVLKTILQNNRNDNIEDASNIVVKELKGRNVTIVKTNTGNKTPKPPSVPNTKVKKEDIENEIISEFEIDSAKIYTLMKDCGLELTGYKCKKCDYECHSDGLRKHKRTTHQLNESNQNIMLGFKNDIGNYVYLLETIGDDLNQITCGKCEFKCNSKGDLKMHEKEIH